MFRSRKFETDEVPIIKAPLIHMLFLLAFTSILIVLQSAEQKYERDSGLEMFAARSFGSPLA